MEGMQENKTSKLEEPHVPQKEPQPQPQPQPQAELQPEAESQPQAKVSCLIFEK